ncbi:hypothetical protein [Chryseobacterium camelliae]|uniref:hypothetical protein n=1 Tax=Chryseobacterium camelliae TaxID=1265445 RepID=UPI00285FAB00|nr:hypothetical protein [Chryseobacterium camelliae]MDR6513707.1 hypothetical protein [Chryseobacterium camelliae]
MTLYYIAIGLDYDTYSLRENDYRYEFQLKTRFISNYLSKEIRKLKFKTDGTFNMINIALHENQTYKIDIKPIDVLNVELPFDRATYEKIKGGENCDFYISLIERGFKDAAAFKDVPLDDMLTILNRFKTNGCKNEWLLKKLKLKDDNIELIFECQFTTNYFQIVASIRQLSTKRIISKEVIIRTEADESVFDIIKDVKCKGEYIFIVSRFDDDIAKFKISDLAKGNIDAELIGNKKLKEQFSFNIKK